MHRGLLVAGVMLATGSFAGCCHNYCACGYHTYPAVVDDGPGCIADYDACEMCECAPEPSHCCCGNSPGLGSRLRSLFAHCRLPRRCGRSLFGGGACCGGCAEEIGCGCGCGCGCGMVDSYAWPEMPTPGVLSQPLPAPGTKDDSSDSPEGEFLPPLRFQGTIAPARQPQAHQRHWVPAQR